MNLHDIPTIPGGQPFLDYLYNRYGQEYTWEWRAGQVGYIRVDDEDRNWHSVEWDSFASYVRGYQDRTGISLAHYQYPRRRR